MALAWAAQILALNCSLKFRAASRTSLVVCKMRFLLVEQRRERLDLGTKQRLADLNFARHDAHHVGDHSQGLEMPLPLRGGDESRARRNRRPHLEVRIEVGRSCISRFLFDGYPQEFAKARLSSTVRLPAILRELRPNSPRSRHMSARLADSDGAPFRKSGNFCHHRAASGSTEMPLAASSSPSGKVLVTVPDRRPDFIGAKRHARTTSTQVFHRIAEMCELPIEN